METRCNGNSLPLMDQKDSLFQMGSILPFL